MPGSGERLQEMLEHRELVVDLEGTLERRVRAYGERLNARLAAERDDDPYDLEDDRDLAQVVMFLCEAALDDERMRGRED